MKIALSDLKITKGEIKKLFKIHALIPQLNKNSKINYETKYKNACCIIYSTLEY